MELETQVQVSGNQLKRQDEDNKALAERLETTQSKVKELTSKLKEQQHKYSDLESKVRYVEFKVSDLWIYKIKTTHCIQGEWPWI